MPWVRLDDQFNDHPKVLEVGPLAECLYVRGLTYASRFLTDGFVPLPHLRRMGDLDAMAEAEKLVAVGLWDRSENGFHIHDYLDYQPSAEKVKAEREANAKRQAEWRDRKAEERRNVVTNAVSNGPVTPAPTRTRPTPVNDSPDGESRERPNGANAPRSRSKTRQTIPDDFEPSADDRAWAASRGLDEVDVDREIEKFVVHYQATGGLMKDWRLAWRNWILKIPEFSRGKNGREPQISGRLDNAKYKGGKHLAVKGG